jgi:transposase
MPVPAIPVSLLEPVWVEFAALLPERAEFHPDHPLGCHRRRIPDRVVFEHLVDALVHGSGYERIASVACSGSTIRRRLTTWSAAGIAEQVHAVALVAYDRIIGLQLGDIAADGCITKAPCGGDKAQSQEVERCRRWAWGG